MSRASTIVTAARAAVLPEELRQLLEGAISMTVIADGPLAGVPLEVLLEDTPIAYAPSATIAIDRRRAAQQRTTQLASAVVVGDPGCRFSTGPSPSLGVRIQSRMTLTLSNAGISLDTHAGCRRVRAE